MGVFYRERSERERRERDLSEAAPEPLSPSRRFEGRDNEGKDVLNYQYRRRREHGPFVQLKPQHCNRRGIQENHRITKRFEERRWRGQDRWLRALSQAEPDQALLQATPQVHEIHVLQRGLRENRLPKSPSKKESVPPPTTDQTGN